jgi:hypothetical protein
MLIFGASNSPAPKANRSMKNFGCWHSRYFTRVSLCAYDAFSLISRSTKVFPQPK